MFSGQHSHVTLVVGMLNWKHKMTELSLRELSLKNVTLVPLVSAQWMQSLHKLDLNCFPSPCDFFTLSPNREPVDRLLLTQGIDRIRLKIALFKQSRHPLSL